MFAAHLLRVGLHLPGVARTAQRAGIANADGTALSLEQFRVSRDEFAGGRTAPDFAPMDRACGRGLIQRLRFTEVRTAQGGGVDAVAVSQPVKIIRHSVKLCRVLKHRQIAILRHQILSPRKRDPAVVISAGATDQLRVGQRQHLMATGVRIAVVLPECGQLAENPTRRPHHIVAAPQNDIQNLWQRARHRIGLGGLGLNEARVAIARLLSRWFAVNNRDRMPPRLQLQRSCDTHHAAPQNQNFGHERGLL